MANGAAVGQYDYSTIDRRRLLRVVKIEITLPYNCYKMIDEVIVGKLTFKRVNYDDLSYQKQYIIEIIECMHECYVAGRFLERVFGKNPKFIQTNEDGSGYFRPYGTRFFIREINGEKRGLRTFNESALYFELVPKKQKIQQNMEDRALLLILRKVIGDPSFTL